MIGRAWSNAPQRAVNRWQANRARRAEARAAGGTLYDNSESEIRHEARGSTSHPCPRGSHSLGSGERCERREADSVQQIGRASCRERVCQYVSISVVSVSLTQTQFLISYRRAYRDVHMSISPSRSRLHSAQASYYHRHYRSRAYELNTTQ